MTAATIRQCAVIADTPTPLLPCGDRPFLAWLLRELVRFGVAEFVLLTGHLSADMAEAVATLSALSPRPARITIAREPMRGGTGGALWHARDLLDARFLQCNGGSLFDGNLARLLSDAAGDAPDVVGRLLLGQVDDPARRGVAALDGDRVVAFGDRAAVGGAINAGVYLFDRRMLEMLRPQCSLETDILPLLASRGVLRATVAEGWFRDIGVAEEYAAVQREIPLRLHRPALFLDRDGVINIDHGYVGTRERFEWTPGAREAIRMATDAGWHVFVVTNQSGVARGRYTEADVAALHAWMADEVRRAGGTIDDLRYCPFHEDAIVPAYRRASDWRKPAPGMLLDLMRAWSLDPARCLLVGDQPSDMAAAEAAGIAAVRFAGGNLADVVRPLLAR